MISGLATLLQIGLLVLAAAAVIVVLRWLLLMLDSGYAAVEDFFRRTFGSLPPEDASETETYSGSSSAAEKENARRVQELTDALEAERRKAQAERARADRERAERERAQQQRQSQTREEPKGDPFAAACKLLLLRPDGNFTPEDLTRNYHKMRGMAHPDQGGDKTYFVEITRAVELIKARKGWK